MLSQKHRYELSLRSGAKCADGRWPVIPPWVDKVEGSLWSDLRQDWKEELYQMMRKDAGFLTAYKMPAIKLTEDTGKGKAAVQEEEEIPVLEDGRAKTVGMAIVQLMMKYRHVMKAPGKSREERERDFIVLMRNKLLGMEDDIVKVEKHLDLLFACYPKDGKVKKKDEIIEYKETEDLHSAWPDFNINTTEGRIPFLCDRMLLEMTRIPQYQLRISCGKTMMALSKDLDARVAKVVQGCEQYTEAVQQVLKCNSLSNVLKGTVTVANFLNHIVILARMNLMEKQKCKETVGFDLEDAYENLTSYLSSKEWQDNDQKSSIMEYVLSFLSNMKDDDGIKIEELRTTSNAIEEALKNKLWKLEADSDEIEAGINKLRRAIGELNDYEELIMEVDGVPTKVSEDKLVEPCNIPGSTDNFRKVATEFVNATKKFVPMMRETRIKMYKANMMLVTHTTKKDTSTDYKSGLLALPDENNKMPAAERTLRLLSVILSNTISVYESTQKGSVYAAGISKAGL